MKIWHLPAEDDRAGWRRLLFAGVAVALVSYALAAFFEPHSWRWDPWAIQDDARQFLSWMPRLLDPALLQGDLQANYWHAVSPRLYRALFEIMAALGVPPPVMGRLIPLILIPLLAIAAWPLALRMAGNASMAFLGASFIVIAALHGDGIFSGTPRGFAGPLVLLFLGGLVCDKPKPLLTGLGLLAFLYPALAITCLAMLGLSRLRLSDKPGIDLSRRSVLIVGAATLLVASAGVMFHGETENWGPTVTREQARTIPAMISPEGRSTIVQKDGSTGWISGPRMGFLPVVIKNRKSLVDFGAIVNIVFFLPMLYLAIRAVRRRDAADKDHIYIIAIAAASLCWAVAFFFAFKLHLPSRYSRGLLEPLQALAWAQLAGDFISTRLQGNKRRMAAGVLAILLAAGFLQHDTLIRPLDRAGVAAIAALPKESRLAGISVDLSLASALTGCSVLASTEQAIPYQLGYYRPFRERLQDSATALRSSDPQTIADFIRRYDVTVIVIDPAVLERGALPLPYAKALPEIAAETGEPLALARAPEECSIYKGQYMLLFDAACLLRWSGR